MITSPTTTAPSATQLFGLILGSPQFDNSLHHNTLPGR